MRKVNAKNLYKVAINMFRYQVVFVRNILVTYTYITILITEI